MKMLEPVNLSENDSPTVYPVSLAEVKSHLRIDDDDSQDSVIYSLIDTALGKVNGYFGDLGISLLNQSWRVDFDDFPTSGRRIDLPVSPAQSITSITYFDSDNVQQTLASADYALHEDARGPFVWLNEGADYFPGTYNRPDAVSITFVAGHGTAAGDIPREIRNALLLMIGHWYENREQTTEARMFDIPWGVRDLLFNHMRQRF